MQQDGDPLNVHQGPTPSPSKAWSPIFQEMQDCYHEPVVLRLQNAAAEPGALVKIQIPMPALGALLQSIKARPETLYL